MELVYVESYSCSSLIELSIKETLGIPSSWPFGEHIPVEGEAYLHNMPLNSSG